MKITTILGAVLALVAAVFYWNMPTKKENVYVPVYPSDTELNAWAMKTAAAIAYNQPTVVDKELRCSIEQNRNGKCPIDLPITVDGRSAVHLAGLYANQELSRVIVYKKLDFNLLDKKGNGALHYAVMADNKIFAEEALLYTDIDVNIKNSVTGDTPLHIAAAYAKTEFITLLLNHGAGLHLKNHLGLEPLHVAAITGKADVIPYFTNNGCSPNDTTADGTTVLEIAKKYNQIDFISSLTSLSFSGVDLRKEK